MFSEDQSKLYLGKDDSWPYKLVLRGRPVGGLLDARKVGPDGRRIGSTSSTARSDPVEINLEYTNVKLNTAIRVDEFDFTAGATEHVDDNTAVIVRLLDQGIALQAERERAEAAK